MPDPVRAPRSTDEALALGRECASNGSYVLSEAAHERLQAQGLSQSDVVNVLASATACSHVSGRRWNIQGHSLDGQPMSILVAYDDGALTVL